MTYVLPIVSALITVPARRAVERHRSARETENGKTDTYQEHPSRSKHPVLMYGMPL